MLLIKNSVSGSPSLSERVGFTLIEIMIVVVIIGIAALTAIPMFSSASSVQIRSAADTVASDMEYAKSMAISKASDYSVVFDKVGNSYRIEDSLGNVISHPTKKGFDYELDFDQESRLNKVEISEVVFDGGSKVTFDYMGCPKNDSGGDLLSGYVVLRAGDTTSRISVEPVTGFISIGD